MFEVEITYYRRGYVDHVDTFEELTLDGASDRIEGETEIDTLAEVIAEAIREDGAYHLEDWERNVTVDVRPCALSAPDLPEPCNQTKGAADVC